jgi:hypothetical protein
MKNSPAYTKKWGTIFGKFKKIFYHVLKSWQNEDYWVMSP